ncbi:allantoinase AllB [Marinicella litoralis]|uniref:allantoinase n=1 Tax=Marinicella litoralis TaxID=644220 RepID=A0A4R6XW11_9GAMM|nr:allantoinase AllB [Marinicella litoralis]TDR20668.1 allantoinase [Marinicella litoralis]
MKAFSSTQVFYQGTLQAATVLIDQGLISAVVGHLNVPSDCEHQDCGDHIIMPGLVDSHVHINEPGRTDWEGFNTATQAAAAGGITTVIDMPLNCIPVTTDMAALQAKLDSLKDQLWVDVGFHGGVIPGNSNELSAMMQAGIKSFKAFMIDSGVDEFPASDIATLDQAMPILAAGGATLLVHAEMDPHALSPDTETPDNLSSYQSFLASRPDSWETDAIAAIIKLSSKHNCKVHVVHLSSCQALDMIADAKHQGIPITAETCPHYLTLAAETIPDGDARFKCCPPIRPQHNQEQLWKGLEVGTIDFIVSDHSPCTPHLKLLEEHNLWEAWGGISSLQFGLGLIWTAIKKRGYTVADLVKWMCEKPAELVQLANQKGRIETGYDADLVIWNPEQSQIIDAKQTFHKHKASAYEEVEVFGTVQQTILRGQTIYDINDQQHFDALIDNQPQGQTLL